MITLSLRAKRFAKLLLLALVLVLMNSGGSWLAQQIDFQLFPRHESMLQFIVAGCALLYILLMAIPFLPGIEVGLTLMILLGNKGALLIYLCTVLALAMSFTIGKRLPPRLIKMLLNWLYLYKASGLVDQLEPLDSHRRIDHLCENAPSRLVPFLIRHRYLAIATIINLPGNALIGGGGGIGIIVGMSNIIPFHKFILLIAVAVAPVPLLFFFKII